MRKISGLQILAFLTLFLAALALALASTWIALGGVPLGDFRGVVLSLSALIGFYVYGIIVYRLFLRIFPLKAGEIAKSSPQEFVYHVYVLFYLLIFYPVMRSGFMPAPLMRLFYLALGARARRQHLQPRDHPRSRVCRDRPRLGGRAVGAADSPCDRR